MITGVKVKTVTPYGQHIKILYTFKQFETLYEHNNEFRDKLFDWEQTVYGMRPTKAVIKKGDSYQTFWFKFPPTKITQTL
ncbi:hypothetical protein KXP72_000996 [Staphylococcus pseudintermedius]|uniref:hypothetical protein n=1 Tax=Staphylococcus pseudintermedius TaxID=283734 RepID=UPI00111FCD18|nr:hypothetical protein [Staphylococcus pseudintermedius]EGQ3972548.1 hypothetical protein [Staphylococcus pseudintermedius]EHT3656543.1 hypothetical protein [Staphylococcus pseudintermedius]EIE3866219.1 hypothetical protein [Staphylococcus pseudintermedius]EII6303276.1 hypothetical protein [Staphylococcus pseudintermedius]EKF8766699.1 hypothetical protein [Staphylococcus pseudintermedius]